MDFIQQLKNHRSIRKFTNEQIPVEDLQNWIQAGQSASTSHHIQAYHLIHVTDPELRAQIAELAGGQGYVASAAHFLIYCADLRKINRAAIRHGKTAKFNLESFLTTVIDSSLVAQNVMLAAESQGFGGVYIGGIRNNLVELIDLLGVPKLVVPLFGMCLGRPAHDPDQKPRLPLDAIYSQNGYPDDAAIDAQLDNYDVEMTAYYASRKYNTREDNWTQMIAEFVGEPHRAYLRSLVDSQGFVLD